MPSGSLDPLPLNDATKFVAEDVNAAVGNTFDAETVIGCDTVFVPRAESVYVFGQVKNPGAYALQQKNTSVLQALSLAGGVTDRGSTARIKIARMVKGEKQEIHVKLSDMVQPGDTIIVQERFF